MRGHKDSQGAFFYSLNLNKLVPPDDPLRPIKKLVDEELARLSPKFDAAYQNWGRPSVPPEMLIKATLLQVLFSIRSDRQICEQIGYNMRFRWFLDIKPDAEVWDHSSFTRNRQRFAEHGLMDAFFQGTVAKAIQEQAVSSEHFSVDGTLIQSMASLKSFRPKDDDDQPPTGGPMPGPTSKARSAVTTPTKARPIRKPGSTAKAMAARPCCTTACTL